MAETTETRLCNATDARVDAIELRNGDSFAIPKNSNRYLETFLVNPWGEHLRQHERVTKADRELEERIRSHTLKERTVRHLIYAAPQ
jgi:hypothetical protein